MEDFPLFEELARKILALYGFAAVNARNTQKQLLVRYEME